MNLTIPEVALNMGLDSQTGSDRPKAIHDAAQQFESLLISEMLKSARNANGDGWFGSGGDSSSESAMDMAESQFASALSKSGGLGLSATIEKVLAPQAQKAQKLTESLIPDDSRSAGHHE